MTSVELLMNFGDFREIGKVGVLMENPLICEFCCVICIVIEVCCVYVSVKCRFWFASCGVRVMASREAKLR
jgi:hypothetical protein